MRRITGDYFNLFTIITCGILIVVGVYWLAAIAFAAIALIFGVVSALASRVFHWPVKKVAIPVAMRLQIGRTRPAAWLGIFVVALCLLLSAAVIRDFNAPAVRRIGQGLAQVKERLGSYGEKIDTIAAEGVGYQRLERWSDWIWAEDVSGDDTEMQLAKENNTVPATLFQLSGMVNRWGSELENRIFEGERHPWFTYLYWFFAAVAAPFAMAAFLLTVYQLSARRLASDPGGLTIVLVSLTTLLLSYCLFSAFYLLPYVSHPYHTPGVPFWVATILYTVGGSMCCGVIRANQRVLFSPEHTPDEFLAARAQQGKKVQ